MNNERAEILSGQAPVTGNGNFDRTYPFPNSQLSERHLQVLADWDAIESRSKKSKAFHLGMSAAQYDEHLLMQKQLTNEAGTHTAGRNPGKKFKKL